MGPLRVRAHSREQYFFLWMRDGDGRKANSCLQVGHTFVTRFFRRAAYLHSLEQYMRYGAWLDE